MNIETDNLTLANVGFIDAITLGQGNAGNVIVDTKNLNITDAGYVSTSTNGRGNAGNINITASDITLDGLDSRIESVAQIEAVGNGGNVTITTSNFNITNGGEVSADTSGQGDAGNIDINANSLDLTNQARIDAETKSETGNSQSAANIMLQVAENITLQDNSLISARALGNANGGNVTINAEDGYILAIPAQNNDIIANAAQGNGGNIEISTQGIFGIEERSSTPSNQTNDIDASSEFGLSGEVEINILQVDPSQDSLNIPSAPVETEVAQICEPSDFGNQSEFIVTGRGGIPESPETSFNGDFGLEDWRVGEEDSLFSASSSNESLLRAEDENSEPIVEADSWIVNERGKVVLVAHNTPNTSSELAQQSSNCQAK